MRKYIYLVVGPSGSGKTTVTNELCNRYGYSAVNSFTTRPRRFSGEKGHIFVTQQEFDKLRPKLCAYTKFDGNEYGATPKQVNKSDFYVIDEAGIEYFKKHYRENKIPVVIYIDANPIELEARMTARGDSPMQVTARKKFDAQRVKTDFDFGLPVFYIINNNINETVNAIKNFISLREG